MDTSYDSGALSEHSLSGIYNLAPFAAVDSTNSFKKDKFLSTSMSSQFASIGSMLATVSGLSPRIT